jgi:hypothetical protein
MCGVKGMTAVMDAQKPCVRCGASVPAFPNSRRYCVECRRAVTLEQQKYHSRMRKEAIPQHYTGQCVLCGGEFQYPSGKGCKRRYCSHECSRKGAMAAYKERLRNAGACSVEGCDNPINRPRHKLCENHYCLLRRNGTPSRQWTPRYRYIHTSGYITVKRDGHPLARQDGILFEHRAIAYDKHGGVCPPCFWCNKQLEWASAVVDHLNEVKHDNSPDNLAVACNNCNRARGAMLPFVQSLRPEAVSVFFDRLRAVIAEANREKNANQTTQEATVHTHYSDRAGFPKGVLNNV